VPADFAAALREYVQQGYRVLACGYRPLVGMAVSEVAAAPRSAAARRAHLHGGLTPSSEAVERDLEFLGLIVMQNKLKPESRPAIATLSRVGIRCVMVTGAPVPPVRRPAAHGTGCRRPRADGGACGAALRDGWCRAACAGRRRRSCRCVATSTAESAWPNGFVGAALVWLDLDRNLDPFAQVRAAAVDPRVP
jgi:hypothetical protein